MAKVRNNIVIKGLSGSLGDQLVIKKDKAGRTIVAAKPEFDSNHVFTEAQQATHDKFREAAAYAKDAKDEEVYIRKAEGTPMNPYNVAVADFFHAPEIEELDMENWHGAIGDVVRVRAVDNVKVTQVTIVITDDGGEVLEQGQAVQEEGFWWKYTMTSATPSAAFVVASARDLPGHIGKMRWQDGVGVVEE